MERSLGICIGASSIKAVEIDDKGNVLSSTIKNHECNPRKEFKELLNKIKLSDYNYVALTGRKFKDLVNLPNITEPEATEYALFQYLQESGKKFDALVSLGSENFMLYELDDLGHILNVRTGNKCASGTGEFFLQQIRRMDLSTDEAIKQANVSEPHRVSGRCSVFCKSDCTHALNIGVPAGKISAGLGDMIAAKVLELTGKKENIIGVGGVTRNSYVARRLSEKIKNFFIPESAPYFEALGAAIYAMKNKVAFKDELMFSDEADSFTRLPDLKKYTHMVEFKEKKHGKALEGDECILGLDVGSTTTKAVLLRVSDDSVLASVYLRTNGNPVKASRECYKEINKQLSGINVSIAGLGVTGSGRKIAGLHGLTDGVINEIIAHATGATYFDKDVDTIIEIGGQDAKYTYLVNGVACDYAMNEACSAGTGSFLEEASKESLNINYLDIQDIALQGKNPPNFNDQCAAFISSDIKNASHENIGRDDIVAGLIYSICMNYSNRVKGSRKIGEKVFMQGGVCYNKAVPLAMAGIINKPIVVPPDPGLIGAFGVALEVKNRINNGLLKKSSFDLIELTNREVAYEKPFICPGKPENCDRGCLINVIKINGKNYPFGGICNKYYNMMHNISVDASHLNLVEKRQKMYFKEEKNEGAKTVGIIRSFYVNMLYPLYFGFFNKLGLKVILSDKADPEGMLMTASSFCFPAQIAHGMFMDLVKKKPDYIFMPHVTELYVKGSKMEGPERHCACLIGQSETYYIQSTFRDVSAKIISPVLNFSKGWGTMEEQFVKVGVDLGVTPEKAKQAFLSGVMRLNEVNSFKKKMGEEVLSQLAADKSKIGIVLFGRAYNAFADEANLGIPGKFSSRGVYIIPFDCLAFEDEDNIENMNWAVGQDIVKAAKLVKRHPQLFGAYITNFSCGPDSFLIGYFRDIMGTKPSLTLEIDSHSADAGINTRIEAFLDIVDRFRKLGLKEIPPHSYTPAEVVAEKGSLKFIASDGTKYDATDPRVKMIIPSMGRTTSEAGAAFFRGLGIDASAVKLPDFSVLMVGRGNTSCKECLPLILTTASLLDHIQNRKKTDELLIYFMPTVTGNCRFSQYYVFLKRLVEKKRIENVAFFSLNSTKNYAGLGPLDQLGLLKGIMIADIMDDIKNALLVLPKDKKEAMKVFETQWQKIIRSLETGGKDIYGVLKDVSLELSKIQLRFNLASAKKVLVAGEIYVRKDEFSSQEVIKRLSKRDIVCKRSPVIEWIYYCDYILKNIKSTRIGLRDNAEIFLRRIVQNKLERKIKKILCKSGLYEYEEVDIAKVMEVGSHIINPLLTGETIVVAGGFFHEIGSKAHGMVSIGPFGCMPTRVSEAILSNECKIAGNKRLDGLENIHILKQLNTLPFLSVEADGNPFPQIVEARIEAFALQVERVYEKMVSIQSASK